MLIDRNGPLSSIISYFISTLLADSFGFNQRFSFQLMSDHQVRCDCQSFVRDIPGNKITKNMLSETLFSFHSTFDSLHYYLLKLWLIDIETDRSRDRETEQKGSRAREEDVAVLVLVSRGKIVREDDLARELEGGKSRPQSQVALARRASDAHAIGEYARETRFSRPWSTHDFYTRDWCETRRRKIHEETAASEKARELANERDTRNSHTQLSSRSPDSRFLQFLKIRSPCGMVEFAIGPLAQRFREHFSYSPVLFHTHNNYTTVLFSLTLPHTHTRARTHTVFLVLFPHQQYRITT